MKRFCLFILIALSSAYSFAQYTSMAIESDRHERFWIYINGKQQNHNPESSIQINGLYPDFDYNIRIVMDNRRHSEMSTVVRLHHGQNNYLLSSDSRSGRIRFNATNRPIHAYATYDANQQQHGHYSNNQQYPPQHQHGNQHNYNNQQYPPQHQHGDQHNHNHQQYPPQGNPHQHGHNNNQYPPQQPPTQVIIVEHTTEPAPEPVVMPCSDADFEDAKVTIKNATFEETKLTIAKQIVASELMTARQLAEIASLFDFEHTKLEFLKYAYQFCYDQNKYYIVNNVFDFSSSVDELNEYISKY